MEHNIKTIADNYRIDPTALSRFAVKYHNKYGIIIYEDGYVATTTLFVNDLIKDFRNLTKNQLSWYNKPFLSSYDLIGITVDGWTAAHESIESGALAWTNKQCPDIILYATPDWDEEGKTPIQLVNNAIDDNHKDIVTLEFSASTPLEQQREMYLAVIKTIIKSL